MGQRGIETASGAGVYAVSCSSGGGGGCRHQMQLLSETMDGINSRWSQSLAPRQSFSHRSERPPLRGTGPQRRSWPSGAPAGPQKVPVRFPALGLPGSGPVPAGRRPPPGPGPVTCPGRFRGLSPDVDGPNPGLGDTLDALTNTIYNPELARLPGPGLHDDFHQLRDRSEQRD